jgi:hypothetical protein
MLHNFVIDKYTRQNLVTRALLGFAYQGKDIIIIEYSSSFMDR